jgi:hypothetical protein
LLKAYLDGPKRGFGDRKAASLTANVGKQTGPVSNADPERRFVMSVNNQDQKRRRPRRVVALILVAMAAAGSTASARSLSDPRSLQATFATAETSADVAAAPAVGQVLGGFTSQGWPVVVAFAKQRKKIGLIATGLDMSCTSGESLPLEDGWERLPISASGEVHAAATIPPSPASTISLTGGSHSLFGRFNRQRSVFSGVWRLHLTFKTATGQTAQCDSGRVAFTALL